ncbi:hypothetical protein CYY_010018, partial [Polysphondylium violaceum]
DIEYLLPVEKKKEREKETKEIKGRLKQDIDLFHVYPYSQGVEFKSNQQQVYYEALFFRVFRNKLLFDYIFKSIHWIHQKHNIKVFKLSNSSLSTLVSFSYLFELEQRILHPRLNNNNKSNGNSNNNTKKKSNKRNTTTTATSKNQNGFFYYNSNGNDSDQEDEDDSDSLNNYDYSKDNYISFNSTPSTTIDNNNNNNLEPLSYLDIVKLLRNRMVSLRLLELVYKRYSKYFNHLNGMKSYYIDDGSDVGYDIHLEILTILENATIGGNLESIEFLVSQKYIPSFKCLEIAVAFNYLPIVKYLVKNHSHHIFSTPTTTTVTISKDKFDPQQRILAVAKQYGNSKIERYLLAKISISKFKNFFIGSNSSTKDKDKDKEKEKKELNNK